MININFDLWKNQFNAGFWEYNVDTNKVLWSDSFYHILGYNVGEIEPSYENFKNHLIYYEDRDLFLGSANRQNASPLKSTQIRLLTKRGFEWFQSTMQKQKNATITGTLIGIHAFKIAELESRATHSITLENNHLLQMGSWTLDCGSNELTIQNGGLPFLNILERSITLEGLLRLVDPTDQGYLEDAIADCRQYCRPFELDLLFQTALQSKQSIKIKGYAHIDPWGRCTEIHGTMQNIDLTKKKETDIRLQNEKLRNFSHIVAHNINSYANNLKLVIELHDRSTTEQDRQDLFKIIKRVSSSLTTTIDHLNEIVSSEIQEKEKSPVMFENVLNNTINALYPTIQVTDASISGDFKECEQIYYVPAYMESIFHNMISNSLKYREPSRKTVITCRSEKLDGHVYLIFADNGIGIDMEKYGDKLFGLYQTFHDNKDAHGLGLYITRNQVEQCGGSINVESELNEGSKFIIRLN